MYKIIGNKLYKDGVEVKLEFGNREQIEFLRKEEYRISNIEENEIELHIDIVEKYECDASFKCKCGKYIYIGLEADSEEDIYEDIVGTNKICKCGLKYEVVTNGYNDIVVVEV